MAEVKWIKIVTNIFDDEKIRYIETLPNGDETIVIWFRILCLAGKSNSNGSLMMTDKIAYTDEMLSSIFNRDIKSIQLALGIYQNLGMIEMYDNRIYLTNWEKHQNAEKLELMKEQNRIRVNKFREKHQIGNGKSITEPLQEHYSNAIDIELDLEREKEVDNKSKDIKTSVRFVKPNLEQISEYIQEMNLSIDPNAFFDYYESNGWVVGKNKMKDWKATLRNWNRKEIIKPISKSIKKRIEIESNYNNNFNGLSNDEEESILNSFKNIGDKK